MNTQDESRYPPINPIPDMRSDLGQAPARPETISGAYNPGLNQELNALRTSGEMAQNAHTGTNQAMMPKQSKIEDISIHQLDRGFIVKVGCQTLAIGSAGELIGKLNAYIMNPDKTRELYFSGLI